MDGIRRGLGDWYLRRTATDAVPADWVRPEPDTDERRADLRLGAVLGFGAVVSVVLARSVGMEGTGPRPSLGEELAWALAVSVPIAVRRRYPITVMIFVVAAMIGLQARTVAEPVVSQICPFLAFFTAGAWARDRMISVAARGLVVVVVFCWLAFLLSTAVWDEVLVGVTEGPIPAVLATSILSALVNVLYFGAAWAFGDLAWRSAGQRALLEQRNADLARERDENARRAVLDERLRIARELHDVVAHHVSVMGVQAGAARVVLAHDPDAARASLLAVEQQAREAVQEMRRLLGALRADTGPDTGPAADPPSPTPGVEGLGDLVTGARASGVRVECTVVGTAVPLPPSLSVSIYRIAQEALTNTVRHAGAARADVRLRYLGADGVEIEIVDDGIGTARAPGAGHGHAPGLGLVGMRERVALQSGELEVGPRPGGGFRVRARFPLATSVQPSAPLPSAQQLSAPLPSAIPGRAG